MLMSIRSVRDVLDAARGASIALIGIGSVIREHSIGNEAHPMAQQVHQAHAEEDLCGEFLGHLIDASGQLSDIELNSRIVGLLPSEAARIPTTVGVVSGLEHVAVARAALAGGYINVLVLDEETARGILEFERV